jgi:hypothetical protein
LTQRLGEWKKFMEVPQPSSKTPPTEAHDPKGKGRSTNLSRKTAVHPRATGNIDGNIKGLRLLLEEGGVSLQNFLLAAASQFDANASERTPPPAGLHAKSKREAKLPDTASIHEWNYRDILRFPGNTVRPKGW